MPDELIVPKKLRQVRLWIHPEGRVVDTLYVRTAGGDGPEERTVASLNAAHRFGGLRRQGPEGIRFYHQASTLGVESEAEPPPRGEDLIRHRCELGMMDGNFIEGTLTRPSPPDRSRLFDFLNREKERFLEIFLDDGTTVVVNKTYVIYVRPTEEDQ